MGSVKVAITLDRQTLQSVDGLVSRKVFPNRSRAIQEAVAPLSIVKVRGAVCGRATSVASPLTKPSFRAETLYLPSARPCRTKFPSPSDAAIARRSALGRLRPALEGADELIQAGVVGRVQTQLTIPGRGDHGHC